MSMRINPSKLYTKALCEGGGLMDNGERVFRSFYTKYDKSFVQQIIAKDGSYEMKIWQNDLPTKMVTKSINGLSSTLETWDIKNHTGKIREIVSMNPSAFLQRIFNKNGLSSLENTATITKHTKGRKILKYIDTVEISKQGDSFIPSKGNTKISDTFNAYFNR